MPRDAGTGWDFDDVRDHYLGELFGVDPAELRRYDHERYLELSRAVSARRWAPSSASGGGPARPAAAASSSGSRDLVPGRRLGPGRPLRGAEGGLHALRRALAPRAVWLTDEGLAGVGVHVANDGPEPLAGTLRVAVYGADGRAAARGRPRNLMDAS